MSEQGRNLLKALSRRLTYLLQQEQNPEQAMRHHAARMYDQGLLDTPVRVGPEMWPEVFAEQVTLLNPVLLSKTNEYRQRHLRPQGIEDLNDWLDKVA